MIGADAENPIEVRVATIVQSQLAAAGFRGFKVSGVGTRHNVSQLDAFQQLADDHGAQLRLTRLRPSGRGADAWPDLHPTAGQQRELYDWLAAHGYRYVSFPGPMSVEFGSQHEAVELAQIFYPQAAGEIRRRGSRQVPFEMLGINPPRDLAGRRLFGLARSHRCVCLRPCACGGMGDCNSGRRRLEATASQCCRQDPGASASLLRSCIRCRLDGSSRFSRPAPLLGKDCARPGAPHRNFVSTLGKRCYRAEFRPPAVRSNLRKRGQS